MTQNLPEVRQEKTTYDGKLQLSPIKINEDYRKKWNIIQNDYVCLTRNGELVRDTLYRVGGMGVDLKNDYSLILKHVEAFYEDSITKDADRKRHLESQWCIIDRHGNEKVNFKQFANPYLVADSQIYSVDRKYYNIETGEFYCDSSTSIKSVDYIFLDNAYDKDVSRRGVMKINKKDGSWELFA